MKVRLESRVEDEVRKAFGAACEISIGEKPAGQGRLETAGATGTVTETLQGCLKVTCASWYTKLHTPGWR